MSRTSKRNAWIAGVVALVVLLGLGAWTVASRSTSTDDLAGASSTGNFGSVVTVRNDGGYILQVTNQRTGGVWRLPSCTQDTQWPGNPNIAWDPVTNPAVVVPANPTSCEQSWREVTAGQTIDNKLLIEACIGGTVASAGGAEGCKSGKSSPAFGLRELPIETSSSGGVCGRLSCSAPHYISSGARVILNRVGVIGETWKFNPVGDEGLQANVTNLGNGRTKNPWNYRIDGFSDPKRPIGSRVTVVNRTGSKIYLCDLKSGQRCEADSAQKDPGWLVSCKADWPDEDCERSFARNEGSATDVYLRVDMGSDSNRETCLKTTTSVTRYTARMLLSDYYTECKGNDLVIVTDVQNGWGIASPYPGQQWTWTRDRSKEDESWSRQDLYEWTYLGRNTTDGYAEYKVVISRFG
ncbi:MAG: hypothetical protein F2881_04870 [Actinobacteria bacterium]|uniref:Unannotated protein n=1 Tax=freshwater metagenome TaxID=449393 RepID=A0A6J7PJP3_9ZZZZ|nr:hypothetical protein [Actinomycetota bacterium]